MQMSPSWRSATVVVATLLAGCADPAATGPRLSAPNAAVSPTRAGRVPAAVEWNEVARAAVARNKSSSIVAFRVYTLVSVAQEAALKQAEDAPSSIHPSTRAAIAAASARVLSSYYPAEAALYQGILSGQLGSDAWLEKGKADPVEGAAIGNSAGAAVWEYAKTDGYNDAWTGLPASPYPRTGPGAWIGGTPGGASLSDARTWFLDSPSQFRPAPPPAFGSPEFNAALAEVRQVSDTRTHEQDSIAKFWAFGGGTYTPAGYWNDEASRLAMKYALNEGRATRLLAILNKVGMDAIIASNDAKIFYYLIRPSQADPAITVAIPPLPAFPSYPSNHALISSAMAEILAAAFPAEAERLRADALQAALSRVYGGIHYRFDGEVGNAMGKQVAGYALSKYPNIHAALAGAHEFER